MKKLIMISFIAAAFFSSCHKAEELKYDSAENVYIDYWDSKRDSVLYTFAFSPELGRDTIFIPVRIAGMPRDYDRQFSIQVLKDSSTAVENKHYLPLDSLYTIKKNTTLTWVPLIILNSDPALESKSVSIRVKLFSTKDLGANLPELNKTKVVFSSKLEHENWWNWWFDPTTWSVTKNQFFIIVTGLTSLTENGLDAPKNQYLASLVAAFLADPAKWVAKNPSKGYVLEARADGNYDFYSKQNPDKKILYRKSPLNNLYYFIDENGNEIH